MRSAFVPNLINGPFGDPGLHISFKWGSCALQFDLGRMDRMSPADIHKIRWVFVSHTHMDHFYGFDRVLRLMLARDTTVSLFGPPGIIDNVAGKIAGYTWNLTDGYPFVIEVHEVSPMRIRIARFSAARAFARDDIDEVPFSGCLIENETFRVDAAHLDHRIPSMAFAFRERSHLNIRSSELARMSTAPGRWLNDLKQAIRDGVDDATPFIVPHPSGDAGQSTTWSLGALREALVTESPGQKIGYIVDTIFSRENSEKIARLMDGADVLFCESLLLDEDREEARKRYHLTARQAGTLARIAKVRQLRTFHFSPRYEGRAEELTKEAQQTFRGEIPGDEPFF